MRLTQKIVALTAGLVVALALTTLAFTTDQADRLARESITRGLLETPKMWGRIEAERYGKLRLALRGLLGEPGLAAAIGRGDREVVRASLASAAADDIDADVFGAIDAAGHVLAELRRSGGAGGGALELDPGLVSRALAGSDASGLWRSGGRLFHTVFVPAGTAGGPGGGGALFAAYTVDAAWAGELRRLVRVDFAFLVAEPDGRQVVAASSLGPREGALAALAELGRLPSPPHSAARGVVDLDLAGDSYLAMALPSGGSGELSGASVLALCNHADELGAFHQFRASLVVAAVAFTLVALVLALAFARRLTGPLVRLTEQVERARDGSFRGAVAVAASDEVGTLARAFNRLVAELREKEQLVRFLRRRESTPASPGPAAPLPLDGATATWPALDRGSTLGGRYEIREVLGRGGMGVVYRALDRRLQEVVALKVLRPELVGGEPALVERFKRELRLARRITHRNVVRTHDFDEIDGRPVISMEFVDGIPLKALIRQRGALPLGVGLRIAKEICQGLGAAHAVGVVHRDVKPQNILIVPETGEVKIADFGIARVAGRPEEGATATGMILGTPDYMPPEQAEGRPADERSDIYSLGVVLFEMFTGRLPFEADSVMGVLVKHLQEAPPDPRSSNPALPEGLAETVLRCLQKNPASRPRDVGAVLERIARVSVGTWVSL